MLDRQIRPFLLAVNARTSAWKVLVHVDAAVDAADAEEEREETQPTSNVTTAPKWDTLPGMH